MYNQSSDVSRETCIKVVCNYYGKFDKLDPIFFPKINFSKFNTLTACFEKKFISNDLS